MTGGRFTVAAAQYPLTPFRQWADYRDKLEAWVREAAGKAQLVVFPEYAGMELASLDGPDACRDLGLSIAAASARRAEADALHAELATRHRVHVLAGTLPARGDDGRVRNVARLFTPEGRMGAQDKLMMTRFEDEEWGVSPGSEVHVFDTALGRIGVATCFDVEFPLIARAMAEAGAEIVLAPSCTDTTHGYWRVRIGAQARALENQIHTVQAPLIGESAWLTACDANVGASGVFGPPDKGFPGDGVVALGAMNAPGWVYGTVDLALAAAARADGAVFTARSWPLQPGAQPLSARVVSLI
jgi:predicted amidohydrolase